MELNVNYKLDNGKYKGKTINYIISNDRKYIFELIKQGYVFDENVLSLSGIKKRVGKTTVKNIVVDHEKDDRVYEKDTLTVNKILNDISTIDNIKYKQGEMIEFDNEGEETDKELVDDDEIYNI